MRANGEMLATAESCTGGWIAKACTDIAGSSEWFSISAADSSNPVTASIWDSPAGTRSAVSLPRSRIPSTEYCEKCVENARAAWATVPVASTYLPLAGT